MLRAHWRGYHIASIRSYRDLDVWKGGIDICKVIYRLPRGLPRHELLGLGSQMQRASVSIPSNVYEGHVRSTAHCRNHLLTAMGSLAELETQLILASELYSQTAQAAEDLLGRCDALNRRIRNLLRRLPE